jgi:hypothetical protein
MSKTILSVFLLLILKANSATCQTTVSNANKINYIGGGINYSTHGTGDLRGVSVNVEYKSQFKRRIAYSIGLTTTIHDGQDEIFNITPNGTVLDGSIRYNASGIQLNPTLWYDIIKLKTTNFGIAVGILGRYQSSNFPDQMVTYFPIVTSVPFPLTAFNHTTPQRTFTVGGLANLYLSQKIQDKVEVGARAGVQTDSRGDLISQLGIFINYRIPKL